MDKHIIGVRTQEFHEGLRDVTAFGPKEVKFKKTLLIGKAASLAMHLRGLLYIDNYVQLEYAAASLGIGSIELPFVLKELEHVDFISVVGSGEDIKRIDIRVPEFRSGYADLGERWLQLKPSEVEQAGVQTLEMLHGAPMSITQLTRSLGLDATDFSIMRDVMRSGQLVAVQPVDGTLIAYTPLAVDGNPSVYLDWARKFPTEVQSVMKLLEGRQGLSVSHPDFKQVALQDAVTMGVLMPVQVHGATGVQRFVFAPTGGLDPEERTILDKARALVSCVRYGQDFAAGRPIKYPRRILEILRDNKRFGKGHPDLFSQYGSLVEKMIGAPIDEGGGRWNFEVHDTPENMKAINIAIEMVEHGQSPSTHINLAAKQALLATAGYVSPGTTRPKMGIDAEASTETRSEILRQLTKFARGMGTHD